MFFIRAREELCLTFPLIILTLVTIRKYRMSENSKSTVFQFEVRYNHILNFSEISRRLLSPFVKLASSIKVDNQGSIEERLVLNFDEDNYLITVSWDRILIKVQGAIKNFTESNSIIQTPFLSILDRLMELEGFGNVQNILLAANYVKKFDCDKSKLVKWFSERALNKAVESVFPETTDVAVVVESKMKESEATVSFGPYFGSSELLKRPISLVSNVDLEDFDFSGVMLESKYFMKVSEVNFSTFVDIVKVNEENVQRVWKML